MSNELIIGASGFLGHHLMQHLISMGCRVYGFDRISNGQPSNMIQGDLFDKHALARALSDTNPQVIYHLAGILKSDQPEAFYRLHVLGTVALCDAILEAGIQPLLVIASSSAVYGRSHGFRPITENFQPRPVTHYAVSKLAQEMVAFRYYHAYKLPVICLRIFNLIGPGLSTDLACSSFAYQIALAEQKGKGSIVTGDLSARRDFVDVRDTARGFQMAAMQGEPGQVYNICSGQAVSIQHCLDALLGLSSHTIEVTYDPLRCQKNDVPVQFGSAARLRKRCGWRPHISLQTSLSDLLDDWRQKVTEGT